MMRIDHIAISHLHGDHYFGLFGLLSTYNLLGRTRALNLYGPAPLQDLISAQEAAGETVRGYPLHFHATSTDSPAVLFEDATVKLESFPVRHRIPTTGFLIREKPKEPGVKRAWVSEWNLQPTEILTLKKGEDVRREDGTVIPFSEACHKPPRPRSYAFAADTRYWAKVVEWVRGVDLLYHEATFLHAMKQRAEKTFHTTALQAGRLAKEAGVGRLIMGHISARYEGPDLHLEEAMSVFPDTVAAQDGMVIEVKQRC